METETERRSQALGLGQTVEASICLARQVGNETTFTFSMADTTSPTDGTSRPKATKARIFYEN